MAIASTSIVIFCCGNPYFRRIPSRSRSSSPFFSLLVSRIQSRSLIHDPISMLGLIGTGLVAAAFVAARPGKSAIAAVDSVLISEPANALSLPIWAVHVSSVLEWFLSLFLALID